MADTPGVVLSWLFPSEVSGWFTKCLADVLMYDLTEGSGYMADTSKSGLISLSTGPRIAEARNTIVDNFATLFPNSEWLLMLDSDMTFPPNLLELLLSAANPIEAPIVGGLCFAGGRVNAPYPTMYRQVQRDNYVSIERVYDYPRDAMVRVGATGGACLLMHRTALAAIKNRYGQDENGVQQPYPWFAEGVVGPDGEPWGEDILFCLRANALGIPVWVNTAVKLGHVKTHVIDETYYDNYQRSAELTAQGAYGDRNPYDTVEVIPVGPAPEPNRAARRAAARAKVSV